MRRILVGTISVLALLALFFVGTVAGVVASYSRHLPDINRMADFQPSSSTIIYARDGTQLAQLYKQNRTWVPISKIPPMVRNAFIATEDRNFYEHHGLDFGGIARAVIADYRGGGRLQGASTITQQLARALFLSNEQTMSRKIQEALLALEIERNYTKDEILERYLNIIYFGAGAYGIEAASHTYFGTDVGHLTIAQAAMLAGLPAAPSDYSPYTNLAHARSRQSHVLDRMLASGYITKAQQEEAENAPLGLIGERPVGLQSFAYPYYTTYAIHQLEQTFGSRTVYEGGLRVDTSLDPALQRFAQEAISWGISRSVHEGIGAHQAALVAIRPSTGEIVAMVGGNGFTLSNQFNRAWQAQRQPGSSFKAFVYTAAIDSGKTPTTVVDDSRVTYPAGDGKTWIPQDDDHLYLGPIELRYALAQSRNIVAVKLAQDIGVDRVIEYAKRMGVNSPLEANLSLALGTSVVTPLDMATGYATIANGGVHITPTAVRMVRNSLGSPILDNRYPEQTEVFSAGTAYVVTSMLESVIQEGTGYPNAMIGRPAAGKTGTTSDYRDAWFVGFTPDLVAAVWLGNDDYRQMNESYGGNIPARIWARFMHNALQKTPQHDFTFPSDQVTRVAVCGGRAGRYEFYINGTAPAAGCAPGAGITPPKGVVMADDAATAAPSAKATAVAAQAARTPTPLPSATPSPTPAVQAVDTTAPIAPDPSGT